jgi:polyisoprenyl-phosphate glycosyltransferase
MSNPIASRSPLTLSVVVPCHNEEGTLPKFIEKAKASCNTYTGQRYEIIIIDDGSDDDTLSVIKAAALEDPRIIGVELSRNHGHQLAITAGLSLCRGDRVLIIDADLQDPPELLGEMMRLMDQGYDVVYGQRRTRKGEKKFKLLTADLFYRALYFLSEVKIPPDTGDFRLMRRDILDKLNSMPERDRFLRGMVSWLGGRQIPLIYDRDSRYAGSTRYTLWQMARLAGDGIIGFSAAPLRLATAFAVLSAFATVLIAIYALLSYLYLGVVQGWTSTVLTIIFFSAIQLLSIGIIGEYIGRIYMNTKGRPLFVIRNIHWSGNYEQLPGTDK